ncbi:hypothetical protein AWN90_07480 [Nocardia terpenica]|uniref:Uncharacterized protein n=1 Tax=Nocardia terpenica TaxID=455432 RepID=A0A164INW4_9NOCA|nr:hypothetical protein AWN90_07480 [Nocardia terpenica]
MARTHVQQSHPRQSFIVVAAMVVGLQLDRHPRLGLSPCVVDPGCEARLGQLRDCVSQLCRVISYVVGQFLFVFSEFVSPGFDALFGEAIANPLGHRIEVPSSRPGQVGKQLPTHFLDSRGVFDDPYAEFQGMLRVIRSNVPLGLVRTTGHEPELGVQLRGIHIVAGLACNDSDCMFQRSQRDQ